jgi:hypothetical protein
LGIGGGNEIQGHWATVVRLAIRRALTIEFMPFRWPVAVEALCGCRLVPAVGPPQYCVHALLDNCDIGKRGMEDSSGRLPGT